MTEKDFTMKESAKNTNTMRDFKATSKKRKFPISLELGKVLVFLKSSVKRIFGKMRLLDRKPAKTEDVDSRRRAFLKYAAFGGAVFVAGKYVNPLINAIRGDTVLSERTFENFKITETGRKLLVTDDDGGEILTIDKESF
jgi:hypothetical protein